MLEIWFSFCPFPFTLDLIIYSKRAETLSALLTVGNSSI